MGFYFIDFIFKIIGALLFFAAVYYGVALLFFVIYIIATSIWDFLVAVWNFISSYWFYGVALFCCGWVIWKLFKGFYRLVTGNYFTVK